MKRFVSLIILGVLTLFSVNVNAAADLSGYWTIKTQDGTSGWMTLVANGPMKYNGQIAVQGCSTSNIEVTAPGNAGEHVFSYSAFCWINGGSTYGGFDSILANPTTIVNGAFRIGGGPNTFYTDGRLKFNMFKQ